MVNFIAVAIGGALGAVTRYGIGVWMSNKWIYSFPWHTFLINISGSFLLGFFNGLFLDKIPVSPELRIALTVGFLGAFTTFSTFGYEAILLIKEGELFTAGLYALASVIIALVGVFLGMGLARLF